MNLLYVFIGGGLGSIVRYLVSKLTTSDFSNINPLGTLLANISASMLLAILLYFFHQRYGLSQPIKLLLVTGFCGGFSTFSTFSYETYELFRLGFPWYGIANILVSIGFGVLIMVLFSRLSIA